MLTGMNFIRLGRSYWEKTARYHSHLRKGRPGQKKDVKAVEPNVQWR